MRRLSMIRLLFCSAALVLFLAPFASAQWSLVAEYSQADGSPFIPGHEGELPEILTFRWGLVPSEYDPNVGIVADWQANVTAADVGRTYEARLLGFDAPWFDGASFWSMFEVADNLLGPDLSYPVVPIAERTVPIDRVTITVDDWRVQLRDDGLGGASGAITARFYTAIPEPATAWLALVTLIGSLMSRHRSYSG